MENRILKRGQGTLETTVVMIAMVLLLASAMQIWLWGNKQMVIRQKRYNASRVEAGKSRDDYVLRWPVYTPEKLNEDE